MAVFHTTSSPRRVTGGGCAPGPSDTPCVEVSPIADAAHGPPQKPPTPEDCDCSVPVGFSRDDALAWGCVPPFLALVSLSFHR